MQPFGSSPRKTRRGTPSDALLSLFAARRNGILLAVGLVGAATLVPAAHAQNGGGGGTINIPRVAPYLPPNAPQQMIDQDFRLRYLDALEKARRQYMQSAAMVPYRKAFGQGIGGRQTIKFPTIEDGLREGGTQTPVVDPIKTRDLMPPVISAPKKRLGLGGGGIGYAVANASRINIGSTQGVWAFSGPQFLTPPAFPGFPSSLGKQDVIGRINGVAFDPTSGKIDAFGTVSPEVFYVATANGGVWRYTEGTNHPIPTDPTVLSYGPWEVLSDFSFPTLSTTSIAVHPTNNKILYVGTGDYPAQLGTGYGNGIMRSVDGGKTWLNIGTNLGRSAVSALTIDPELPQIVMATTGRGLDPGYIWRSTDRGDNFTNVSPTDAQGNPIAGNWSSIDYSARSPATGRAYYASCENVGVYVSLNQGATWSRIDQNVNGGAGLVYNTKVTAANGFGLQVSASKLPYQSQFPAQMAGQTPSIPQGPDIVYIIDSAPEFVDGKIFKSLDRGLNWIDVTGTFPTNATNLPNNLLIDNNWFASNYALRLRAATVPLTDFTAAPNPVTGLYPVRAQEGLYGSGRTFSGTRGGVSLNGSSFLYSFDPITQTISPTLFDLGASGLWTDISLSLGFNNSVFNGQIVAPETHLDLHDSVVSPNDNTRIIVANDGGVNRFTYAPGYASPGNPSSFVFLGNSAWALDDRENLNSELGIGLIEKGDFIQTSPSHYRSTGTISNNTAFVGDLDFTTDPTKPALTNTSWNFVPFYLTGSFNVIVPDIPTGPPAANTNGVPATNSPPLVFNIYANASIFDKYDPTGQTLYANTDYRGAWPNRRLYYTRDNWATYQDISPDRFLSNNGGGTPAQDRNGRQPLYVYNTIDPGDSATATNWAGEFKPTDTVTGGLIMTTGLSGFIPHVVYTSPALVPLPNNNQLSSVMYVGAQYLWRFDPPGVATVPRLPGTTAPATAPNPDYGTWRRVGSTQLATGQDYITAIAVNNPSPTTNQGDVIYVGTHEGKLWLIQNATRHSRAAPLPALNSPWVQLGGLGSNNMTLPNAVAPVAPAVQSPITSISINTDPQSATFGDILVGYGNAGFSKQGGLYRGANVIGPQIGVPPVFTRQTGQGFASLPNAAINEIVRDPDDATNTLFAATDVGVFASTNGGATWSNATAPLGLPNVQCTSLKIVGTSDPNDTRFLMVSTYGRGVFRFDLNNIKLAAQNTQLTFTQTYARTGSEIIVNLTIANSGSTAQNVVLGGASLSVGAGANTVVTNSTSVPLTVGSIGAGQSQTVALRFPASVGRPGTAVIFKVNGTYTVPPFPPGTSVNFDNGAGSRTRLP